MGLPVDSMMYFITYHHSGGPNQTTLAIHQSQSVHQPLLTHSQPKCLCVGEIHSLFPLLSAFKANPSTPKKRVSKRVSNATSSLPLSDHPPKPTSFLLPKSRKEEKTRTRKTHRSDASRNANRNASEFLGLHAGRGVLHVSGSAKR